MLIQVSIKKLKSYNFLVIYTFHNDFRINSSNFFIQDILERQNIKYY